MGGGKGGGEHFWEKGTKAQLTCFATAGKALLKETRSADHKTATETGDLLPRPQRHHNLSREGEICLFLLSDQEREVKLMPKLILLFHYFIATASISQIHGRETPRVNPCLSANTSHPCLAQHRQCLFDPCSYSDWSQKGVILLSTSRVGFHLFSFILGVIWKWWGKWSYPKCGTYASEETRGTPEQWHLPLFRFRISISRFCCCCF